MKYGICHTNEKNIRMAFRLGYDFVEVNHMKIAEMEEAQFDSLLALRAELPDGFFAAANGLLPGQMRIVGDLDRPEVDLAEIEGYLSHGFSRLARLGVKTVVFGSSKAKEVPVGFPRERAYLQIVAAVDLFGRIGADYGLSIAIEPLSRQECNIVHTLKEAAEIAEAVALPNVGIHADYFHMIENGDDAADFQNLVSYAPLLLHTHIAAPKTRTVLRREDGNDYSPFFHALRKGGRETLTLSFEGRGGDNEADAGQMLDYLRAL